MVGVKGAVLESDSPVVRREIRHLQFAPSSQTGSCEAHRHSTLGERLPRQRHEGDANRQKCNCINAHRASASHSVSCSRCHWAFSCFMNATNSESLRTRSRFGSLATEG